MKEWKGETYNLLFEVSPVVGPVGNQMYPLKERQERTGPSRGRDDFHFSHVEFEVPVETS